MPITNSTYYVKKCFDITFTEIVNITIFDKIRFWLGMFKNPDHFVSSFIATFLTDEKDL